MQTSIDQPIYALCERILEGFTPESGNEACRGETSCRCIEVPWTTQKIRDLRCRSILDVGISLANIDFLGVMVLLRERYGIEIEGVDIVRPERVASRYPEAIRDKVLDIPVVVQDIREAELPEERYDAVTLISVIEHIGFDKASCNDPKSAFDRATCEEDVQLHRSQDVDRIVMDNVARTLNPGGHLLITVPMGAGGPVVLKDSLGLYCAQWEYETQSWTKLLDHPKFEIIEEEYWALSSDGWVERPDAASLAEQNSVHLSHSTGCALAMLRKKNL